MARSGTQAGEMGAVSRVVFRCAATLWISAALVQGCGSSHGPGDLTDGGATGVDGGFVARDAYVAPERDAFVAPGADAGHDARTVVPIDAGPGEIDLFGCDDPTDCVVRPRSCCGMCGAATPDDMIGIRADRRSQYTSATCTGALCPACVAMQEPELIATCTIREVGRCEALDLRSTDITACTRNEDCVLREPDCCSCGTTDPRAVIALNRTRISDLLSLVCNPAIDCELCEAPVEPEFTVARCDRGRCVVEEVDSATP